LLDRITVHGARQHNLKNIDVEIPRNTFTVITGLSGSGKSSLAFDTIYAEGQRRYVETLSPYAHQFLDQMERPEVDSVDKEETAGAFGNAWRNRACRRPTS
jgi:excinuclease ABC subunit A